MELVEFAELNWRAREDYKQFDDGASRHRAGRDKREQKEEACGGELELARDVGDVTWSRFPCLELKSEGLSWTCELWSPQHVGESPEIRPK